MIKIQQGSRWLFYALACVCVLIFIIIAYQTYGVLGVFSFQMMLSGYIILILMPVILLTYYRAYVVSIISMMIYLFLTFSSMVTVVSQPWVFNSGYLLGEVFGVLSIILGMLFIFSLKQRLSFKR